MKDHKFQVGLIRVLTSEDQDFVNMHGRQIMDAYPGIEVESRCIPDQYEGIHSQELCEIAVPKITALAQQAFADKDMIIVSCADDPGVEEIRRALPGMRVTGGGETTVGIALGYSDRVGVLGITDYAPSAYVRILGDRLVANVRPEGVQSTLDLMTPEGREACIRAGMRLKEMGAGVIALGCTGLATIGIARELEKTVGLPVIDPVLAEGLFAYFASVNR
ncbi:MAG: hydantoin racemase [Lachnospiraceae bacterium]|nr:hydantoin racemase [Lachnospiraceae bacterium]